jgi:hypothetical protein
MRESYLNRTCGQYGYKFEKIRHSTLKVKEIESEMERLKRVDFHFIEVYITPINKKEGEKNELINYSRRGER